MGYELFICPPDGVAGVPPQKVAEAFKSVGWEVLDDEGCL